MVYEKRHRRMGGRYPDVVGVLGTNSEKWSLNWQNLHQGDERHEQCSYQKRMFWTAFYKQAIEGGWSPANSLMSKHWRGQAPRGNTGSSFLCELEAILKAHAHPKREWTSPENWNGEDHVTAVSWDLPCDNEPDAGGEKDDVEAETTALVWMHWVRLGHLGKMLQDEGRTIYWGFL